MYCIKDILANAPCIVKNRMIYEKCKRYILVYGGEVTVASCCELSLYRFFESFGAGDFAKTSAKGHYRVNIY